MCEAQNGGNSYRPNNAMNCWTTDHDQMNGHGDHNHHQVVYGTHNQEQHLLGASPDTTCMPLRYYILNNIITYLYMMHVPFT